MEKTKNVSGMWKEIKKIAFHTLLQSTKDMVFIKDVNHVYVGASVPFVKMVGKNCVEDILGKTDLEIFEDAHLAERYIADDCKLIEEGEDLLDYIEPITDDDGRHRYGSTSKYILRDDEGNAIGLLGVTKDITREYFARQHYQKELKYLFELPDDVYGVTYIDVDAWRIISQRRRLISAGTVPHCYTVESLCEAAITSILDESPETKEFYSHFTKERLHQIYDNGVNNMTFKYLRVMSDESERWIHDEVRFLRDVDSGHLCVMLTARDIDESKRKQQELEEAAVIDKMTMLLNRETTMQRIRDILKDKQDKRHALFMIDADNFKKLNDTLGHRAGDEFLVSMAAKIKKCFREQDVVGRIGGDEFFAFMSDLPANSHLEERAEKLLMEIQEVCNPYSDLGVSASIGVSVYPKDGPTLDEMYSQADYALYQAKKDGKNRVFFI